MAKDGHSFVAWCPTHEKRLFTKGNAKKAIRQTHNQRGMRRYKCDADPTGTLFHIGHLPYVVRRGYATAREVYGKEQHDDDDRGA